jgi:multidrug efflux pump subunit AcrA (membrane-fusion protein)
MACFAPLRLVPALLAAAAAHAGELTIEPKPFFTEQTFSATALPTEATLIRLNATAWAEFEITQLAAHGSMVASGDILVKFDATDIDKKLADASRTFGASELSLAQAELEYRNLTETVPLKLESIRRAARNAKEENDYFTKTRRKATEEGAAQDLKRAKETLENQQEELRQLAKMYDADDLTEETEEIILVRQRDAVSHAEYALRMETLDHDRILKVRLPREAESLATSEQESTLALAQAEEELPRQLKLEKIQLEAARTSLAREKENLAKLEADRKLFESKAPGAGWFYHGAIEDGRWSTGELVKTLVVGGKAPVKRAFATFIPATTKFGLTAFVDEPSSRTLTPDLKGNATLSGREDLEVPLKLTKLANTPGLDGRYRATLEATWPQGLTITPGTTAEVSLITYEKAAAIVVPTKALSFTPIGWSAEVKLADGKTERRPVKRGRSSKDTIEILSGLEAGQVILTP